MTVGHGTYAIEFQLRDAEGDAVWRWQPADPLDQPDPLVPTQLAFSELRLLVEEPGRYDLVLLAGSDEIVSQPVLIGPAEAFRG